MKLLFDNNLSYKLPGKLGDIFPGSIHVRSVNLGNKDDLLVWEYAQQNGLVVVTKDSDFAFLSQTFGYPPKVVWLKLGNSSTTQVVELLRRNSDEIISVLSDDYGMIEVEI